MRYKLNKDYVLVRDADGNVEIPVSMDNDKHYLVFMDLNDAHHESLTTVRQDQVFRFDTGREMHSALAVAGAYDDLCLSRMFEVKHAKASTNSPYLLLRVTRRLNFEFDVADAVASVDRDLADLVGARLLSDGERLVLEFKGADEVVVNAEDYVFGDLYSNYAEFLGSYECEQHFYGAGNE
jgi:hypothetical protein